MVLSCSVIIGDLFKRTIILPDRACRVNLKSMMNGFFFSAISIKSLINNSLISMHGFYSVSAAGNLGEVYRIMLINVVIFPALLLLYLIESIRLVCDDSLYLLSLGAKNGGLLKNSHFTKVV